MRNNPLKDVEAKDMYYNNHVKLQAYLKELAEVARKNNIKKKKLGFVQLYNFNILFETFFFIDMCQTGPEEMKNLLHVAMWRSSVEFESVEEFSCKSQKAIAYNPSLDLLQKVLTSHEEVVERLEEVNKLHDLLCKLDKIITTVDEPNVKGVEMREKIVRVSESEVIAGRFLGEELEQKVHQRCLARAAAATFYRKEFENVLKILKAVEQERIILELFPKYEKEAIMKDDLFLDKKVLEAGLDSMMKCEKARIESMKSTQECHLKFCKAQELLLLPGKIDAGKELFSLLLDEQNCLNEKLETEEYVISCLEKHLDNFEETCNVLISRFRKKLNEKEEKFLEFASNVEEKLRMLDIQLDAESRKQKTVEDLAKAVKMIETCQDEVDLAKLFLKMKKGDQKAVEDALENLGDAKKKLEDVHRRMLEIRACGFPEIECGTVSRAFYIEGVPVVDLKDHGKVSLGKGSYAEVFKTHLPLVGDVAFKKVTDVNHDVLWKEAQVLRTLRHENVIPLFGVCLNKGMEGLILEYMSGGSLGDGLHKKKEKLQNDRIVQIGLDIACGMEYLHKQKLIHLDLKADNILLDAKGVAKLADFGTTKELRDTMRNTLIAGTFPWMAPETLMSPPSITCAADVYSFGMILFEMTNNEIPFHNQDITGVIKLIQEEEKPEFVIEDIDETMIDMMNQCWSKMNERPSASKIVQEFSKQAIVTCYFTFDDFPKDKGLFCQGGSCCDFLSFEGLEDCVESALLPDISLINPDASLSCGNEGGTFSLQAMSGKISSELFEKVKKVAIEKNICEMRLKFQKKLEEKELELLEKTREGKIRIHVDHVIDNILTLKCPRCKKAFVDFSGCFALKCYQNEQDKNQCSCQFCAYCLKDCGSDAHSHVRDECPFSLNPGNYFGKEEDFLTAQYLRKNRELRKYLVQDISPDILPKVLEALKLHIDEYDVGDLYEK